MYKCICKKEFKTKKALKIHRARTHPKTETLNLLEKGFIPKRTKAGKKFRAKNKIIIS